MAYFLQMDGVDDYLKTPIITFDEVILDIYVDREGSATNVYYFDSRTGGAAYFHRNGTTDRYGGISTIYVDGVQKSWGTLIIPDKQRVITKIIPSAINTDNVNVFSNDGGIVHPKGRIYDVKFYNGGTLVAHYDMTTQTVQDQSGNGNHATLTGGTWVDDGSGGGGSALTISLSDSIGSSDSLVKSINKRLVDLLTTSDSLSKRTSKRLIDSITSNDLFSKSYVKVMNDNVSLSELFDSEDGQPDLFSETITDVIIIKDSLAWRFTDNKLNKTNVDISGSKTHVIYVQGSKFS